MLPFACVLITASAFLASACSSESGGAGGGGGPSSSGDGDGSGAAQSADEREAGVRWCLTIDGAESTYACLDARAANLCAGFDPDFDVCSNETGRCEFAE